MIDKKTVAHNLLFLALGQGVSGVLMFVAMAYLARTLGPHNFGIIGFAEGVLIFFLGLTSFGLDYIGIREVAKARERVRYFTDIIISMRFLLALLSFALLVLFIFILEKPAIIKYVTLIYGISLFCAACLLDWVFQGLEKMQFVAVSSITKAVVFASGVFFLVSGQEDIIKVAIIYSCARTRIYNVYEITGTNAYTNTLPINSGFYLKIIFPAPGSSTGTNNVE